LAKKFGHIMGENLLLIGKEINFSNFFLETILCQENIVAPNKHLTAPKKIQTIIFNDGEMITIFHKTKSARG
jgi:hypothetical protein